MPFGKNFFDVVAPHPDLYGPFWIAATVLFLLAITSNLASYWEYWKKDRADDWNYDFDKVKELVFLHNVSQDCIRCLCCLWLSCNCASNTLGSAKICFQSWPYSS